MKKLPWWANPNSISDDVNDGQDTTVIDRPLAPAKEDEPKVKLPPMFYVWLLNDDYTPYQVVIMVITTVFNLMEDEATRCMRTAHVIGRCLMGMFSKDVAETKAEQVHQECLKYGGFPLQAVIEEAPAAD